MNDVHRAGRCTFALLATAVVASLCTTAYADDEEDARAMFAAGIAALERGEADAARVAFERSLELHPTNSAAFNLAGVLTDLARPSDAFRLYEELERGVYGALSDAQRADVRRLADAVAALTARIEVRVVAPGAVNVTIGERSGVATEDAPFVQRVDPGTHAVRGTAAGCEPAEREVEVRAGGLGRTLLRFEPASSSSDGDELTSSASSDGPVGDALPNAPSGGVDDAVWVILTVGILLVAGGVTTGVVLATQDFDDSTVLPATGTLFEF